jgi:hypothetical protein
VHAQAKRLHLSWGPDIALALLIAFGITAFHGRYLLADKMSLSINDAFQYTLWAAFILTILGCARVVQRLADTARKRRKRYNTSLREDDTGSLSIEFLLTFPWMYIMFGLVIQWGLIGRAKILVDYAAYRAARSAITQVESNTMFLGMYSFNPVSPESVPLERERRVRESAALILAQISPMHADTGRGAWVNYGYGTGRTPAIAMAEAGIPRWPYAMRADPYERRAYWALLELQAQQQGGRGFVLDMRLSPLITFDLNQFGAAITNQFDRLIRMVNQYGEILNEFNMAPSQTGSWGFKIPMPWPIPDIEVGVPLDDNTSSISDMLGLPNPNSIANSIVTDILNPVKTKLLGPLTDMISTLQDRLNELDLENPLTPREANIVLRYPYELRMPLISQLVMPIPQTRSGYRGRFIQIEADVSLQSTGGRAGNPLNLFAGSPIP